MSTLTHRQRVLQALDHREPDRIPMASYPMTDTSYGRLRTHLGLPPAEYRYTEGWAKAEVSNVVMPHEDVLQHFDLDTREGVLTSTKPRLAPEETDEYYVDALGIQYRKHGVWFYYPVKHPLAGERTVADVENYQWPEPGYGVDEETVREQVNAMRRETDAAVVMGVGGTMFHTGWFLCGDDWFVNLATNAPFVEALMEKLLELQLAHAERVLNAIGPDGIDVAVCAGDDYGMQSGPLISTEHYRRFFKPRQRTFIDFVKKRSNARIFVHSDGAVYPLIPDFIDIGAEILNPVQVECSGMEDTRRLKREFGKDLTFWGAIDNQHVLSFGTAQEVKDEVCRRIDDLATGGGFVVTPRGPVRPEVPPENICAIHEAVEEHGHY